MLDIFSSYDNLLDWQALDIELMGSKDFGPCECCGNLSRTIWGLVGTSMQSLAAYYVQWTLNSPKHGANFDFVIGRWGEKSTAAEREAVSVEYRVLGERTGFMVIDAAFRPIVHNGLASAALSRDEVLASPSSQQIFALVDAVFAKDPRLAEIRHWMEL